jgi:hypothetical protein
VTHPLVLAQIMKAAERMFERKIDAEAAEASRDPKYNEAFYIAVSAMIDNANAEVKISFDNYGQIVLATNVIDGLFSGEDERLKQISMFPVISSKVIGEKMPVVITYEFSNGSCIIMKLKEERR